MVFFTSMACTLFKNKLESIHNGHVNTENWLTYFNGHITGCYFHICFILGINNDEKRMS